MCRWFEPNHSSLDAITAKIKHITKDYISLKMHLVHQVGSSMVRARYKNNVSSILVTLTANFY